MPRSSWKLTYDPAGTPQVLLDIGERLVSEIRWGSTRGAEVVQLVDAAAPFLRDTRNREVTVSFERIEPETDHAAVCKAVMTRMIAHGSQVKKALKIEAAGVAECYWLAAACLVPDVETGIRVIGSHEMATGYKLIFASITEVDTTLDPLVTADPTPTDPGDFSLADATPMNPGGFPTTP